MTRPARFLKPRRSLHEAIVLLRMVQEEGLILQTTHGQSIPIVQGQTRWKLPETPGEDILLRVSLKRDASVYDETEFEIYIISPGDINHDGRVNLEDVLLSLQVCAGTDESVVYTDTETSGDGKIGMEEAVYVLQVIAGLRD